MYSRDSYRSRVTLCGAVTLTGHPVADGAVMSLDVENLLCPIRFPPLIIQHAIWLYYRFPLTHPRTSSTPRRVAHDKRPMVFSERTGLQHEYQWMKEKEGTRLQKKTTMRGPLCNFNSHKG